MSTALKKTVFLLTTLSFLVAGLFVSAFITNADTYYTIRINYVFKDGTPAHDSYVAAFPAGKNVNTTVTNPNITGFAPMTAEEGGESAESTVLNYPSIDSNVNITVYYIAGLTRYRAIYYKQNIYDDLYTRDNTLASSYTDRYGYTGTNPNDLENIQFEGFKNLFHEPDAIAADGSTVFRVYYDRNYYSVNFDLGEGGYGVDTVYAKYQSAFHIGEPKRAGYVFKGWIRTNEAGNKFYDKNNVEFSDESQSVQKAFSLYDGTIPAENLYYKAVWEATTTKYSIVYWLQNPDSDPLTRKDIEEKTKNIDEARALIGTHYSVIVAKDVEGVTSGTGVNFDTDVVTADNRAIKLNQFFDYNLNLQGKNKNGSPKTDSSGYPLDSKGKKLDFPDMSAAQRNRLTGDKKRFYEFNSEISQLQFSGPFEENQNKTEIQVLGDGTTRINVYYDRLEFDMNFFYARQELNSNGTPNGKISLTNSTKDFSKQEYYGVEGSDLGTALNKGPWVNNIADSLPQIKDKYQQQGITEKTVKYGNYLYYYYTVKAYYEESLKDKWILDPVTDVHKKGFAENEMCISASWAVEFGTDYYYTHKTVNNFTIKGFYERLGYELMFRESDKRPQKEDLTTLNYLVSWTNTNRTTSPAWNYGINRVLHFKYQNFTELLPKEVIIAENGNGQSLVADGTYKEVRKFKTKVDGQEVWKWYGLKTEQIIDTVDSGDQYDRDKSDATKTKNVRSNQTPADITGFRIEDYDPAKSTKIELNEYNTEVDWSEDTDTDRHATIRFFYRRLIFTLKFRNGNNIDREFNQEVGNGVAYGVSMNKKYADGENAGEYIYYYEPEYPNEDLKDFYRFDGWYYTPYYYRKVDFSKTTMPAEDTTFYAKWVPKIINVSFYNNYNDYYQNVDRIHCIPNPEYDEDNPGETPMWLDGEISTDYGSFLPNIQIPVDTEDENVKRPKLTPPADGAQFAGWYYLRDNIPIRFEPENLQVTALNQEAAKDGKFRLFAEWVTKDVAKYKIRYVEKDNPDREVAQSTTGRAFVYKTKTFNAKCGNDLNAEHAWEEDGINWWPTVNSHSIVVKANEQGKIYAPNEHTFEYVQKNSVHYKVQYLDAVSRTPLEPEQEFVTTHASVEADALFIPGYVATEGTKTLVLSASTKPTEEEQEAEELANNVITFYYNKNDTEYRYEVEYHVQNVDDDNYTLMQKEHLSVAIAQEPNPTTVSVADIYSRHIPQVYAQNGFTRKAGATTVTETNGGVNTYSIADDANIIIAYGHRTTVKVYFDRNKYTYSYEYVDHTQEKRYNEAVEKHENVEGMWDGVISRFENLGPEKVDKEVVIHADQDVEYNGIPYTRIDAKDLTMSIAPPTESNPNINHIRIYYKKFTERELEFKLVCRNENSEYTEIDRDPQTNDPLFGGISLPMQTVDKYDDIQPVNFYNFNDAKVTESGGSESYVHQHKYNFLGWFDNPDGEGTPLTTNEELTKEDLGLSEALPPRDKKYYAVVEQVLVKAKFEFRLVDEALPVDNAAATAVVESATVDENGDYTGCYFDFSAPSTYQNNTPIPWHRTDGYSMSIEPKDDRAYKYEFEEWWEKDLTKEGQPLVRHHNWNSSQEGWSPTSLQNQVTRNGDKYIIAVFKKRPVTELPYTITFRYKDRSKETKDFIVKGKLGVRNDEGKLPEGCDAELTATGSNPTITDKGYFELTNEFIMKHAPYESNYGETLRWTDDPEHLTSTSEKGDDYAGTVDRAVATVVAEQTKRKAHVNYKLTPDESFTTFETEIGANRDTDSNIAAIVAPEYYNDIHFSYWAVRKSADKSAKLVAKCFTMSFTLCIMDDYYITPVYNSKCQNCIVFNTLEDETGLDNDDQWVAYTYRKVEGNDDQVKYPSEDLVFCGLQDYVKFVRIPKNQHPTVPDDTIVSASTDEIKVINGLTYQATGISDENDKLILGHYKSMVTLEQIEYNRNRWTDSEGNVAATGDTDILYSDFEISFADSIYNIAQNPGCKTGIVFEYCGVFSNPSKFDPTKDYKMVTDYDTLATAITEKSTRYCYNGTNNRSIEVVEIPLSSLTNKNRYQYGFGLRNNTNVSKRNSAYLIKASAYFVDETGGYSFSEPVYYNLHNISQCNLYVNNQQD